MTRARVLVGTARRLGARPRLARALLRAPQLIREPHVRAYLQRTLAWPLAKNLHAELDVRVVGGRTMRVKTDDALGRALAVSGIWEPNVTSAFTSRLAPGDVCLDIGAHIGYYSLLASALVGPGGHVYAFEPSPSNFRALRQNVERNALANVTAVNAALGAAHDRAVLYEGPGTNTGRATLRPSLVDDLTTRTRADVDVITIDEAVPQSEQERVRLVKIDVEGSEVDVLRGLEPVFARDRPLTVLLEFTAGWSDDTDAAGWIDAFCKRHGFECYRLMTGYTLEHFFPAEPAEPFAIDSIPLDQCDLLLTR